jgi:hypothetical protein
MGPPRLFAIITPFFQMTPCDTLNVGPPDTERERDATACIRRSRTRHVVSSRKRAWIGGAVSPIVSWARPAARRTRGRAPRSAGARRAPAAPPPPPERRRPRSPAPPQRPHPITSSTSVRSSVITPHTTSSAWLFGQHVFTLYGPFQNK